MATIQWDWKSNNFARRVLRIDLRAAFMCHVLCVSFSHFVLFTCVSTHGVSLSALVNVLIRRPNVYSHTRIPAICTDMKTSWGDVSKTCICNKPEVNKAGTTFKQQTFDSVGMSREGDMSGIIIFNEAFNQFEAIHAWLTLCGMNGVLLVLPDPSHDHTARTVRWQTVSQRYRHGFSLTMRLDLRCGSCLIDP